MGVKSDELTDKQLLFAREYLIDKNATQAAIRAGYSVKTADAIGKENLRKPRIQVEIQKGLDAALERADVSVDRIANEFAKVAFADMGSFLRYNTDTYELTDEMGNPDVRTVQNIVMRPSEEVDTSVIQEVSISKDGTFKFKLHDKLKALDALARWQQMFIDRTQVEQSGSVEYVVRFAGPDED